MSLITVLVLGSTLLYAQDRVITGKVTDETTGEALSGVSVIVKGMKSGTST